MGEREGGRCGGEEGRGKGCVEVREGGLRRVREVG